MKITNLYNELKELVQSTSLQHDIVEADKGNKAAGTRARKKFQEAKTIAQSLRDAILENQKATSGKAVASTPRKK